MSIIWTAVILLVLAGAFFLVKWSYEWRKIRTAADLIWQNNRADVIDGIESIGTEKSSSALLFPSETASSKKNILTVPDFIDSPWTKLSIEIKITDIVEISKLEEPEFLNQIAGQTLSSIKMPRVCLKSGKLQNVWASSRFLQKSKTLKSIFNSIPETKRTEALDYLLGDCVRVSGGLEWLQGAEFPNCSICKKRMMIIFQIPGTLFPRSSSFDIHESEIYIFSCVNHKDKMETVVQFG